MASEKTCPHGADSRVSLSGAQVRDMLARRETLPEFSRPEVARVLMEEYAQGYTGKPLALGCRVGSPSTRRPKLRVPRP